MMEGEWERKNRRTAGQQNPPAQHDSPPTQNVSPQHVDPLGMQKGARPSDAGAMQHCTIRHHQRKPLIAPFSLPHMSTEKLTIRIKTLASQIPRAEIIVRPAAARKDPRFAHRDVTVQRCGEGRCRDVGGGGGGEEGQRGGRAGVGGGGESWVARCIIGAVGWCG